MEGVYVQFCMEFGMTLNCSSLRRGCQAFLFYTPLGPQGSGVWKVTLESQDPSGPHSIVATSKVGNMTQSMSLEDVLFGDVWVCSGQSNMEFTVTQVMYLRG